MLTNCDVLKKGLASVGKSSINRNRMVFKVQLNKEPNYLLCEEWDKPILIKNFD